MKARRFQAVIRIPTPSSKSARVRLKSAQDWFDRSIEVRDAAIAYVNAAAMSPQCEVAWMRLFLAVKAYSRLTKPKKRKR